MKTTQDRPSESPENTLEKQFSVSPLRRALAALVVQIALKGQRDGLCRIDWLFGTYLPPTWTKAQIARAIDDVVLLRLGQIVLKGSQLYLKIYLDGEMPPNLGSPEESGR